MTRAVRRRSLPTMTAADRVPEKPSPRIRPRSNPHETLVAKRCGYGLRG
jgi:hypothetical protein